MVAVEPAELGVSGEILDAVDLRLGPALVEDPTLVGIPKSGAWRVHVPRLVGVAVMSAVTGGPPERTLLNRATAQRREEELEDASGAISPVREVTVVAGCDGKHAEPEQTEAERQIERIDTCDQREGGAGVDSIVVVPEMDYHMSERGENIFTKEKLLAIGDHYEAKLAEDREADEPYR